MVTTNAQSQMIKFMCPCWSQGSATVRMHSLHRLGRVEGFPNGNLETIEGSRDHEVIAIASFCSLSLTVGCCRAFMIFMWVTLT